MARPPPNAHFDAARLAAIVRTSACHMKPSAPKPVERLAPDQRRKLPRSNRWILIGSILAALVFVILIAAATTHFKTSPKDPGLPAGVSKTRPSPQPSPARTGSALESLNTVIDDDGTTFWTSPTDGRPLDLAYLAPGAQVIMAIRPAALLRNLEGRMLFQALGPFGQQIAAHMESVIPPSPDAIEQVVIGCQPTSDGRWLNTFVVHASQTINEARVLTRLPRATKKTYKESTYYAAGGMAYFLPAVQTKNILVAAPEEAVGDIIDLAGQPPALRRDIERLIAGTDSNRQFTVVLAPNALFSEGQHLFSGELAPLRSALFWFLGDEFSGAALSLHWDANFFVEVIATPTLETSSEKAARVLEARVDQIPRKLELFTSQLKLQPYSRVLIERFPEMTRMLAAYTRSGFEKGQVVLRCYLPPAAGHNLLMASELTLAEATSGATLVADATKPTSAQNGDANAGTSGLAKVTSLKFARDTLESALEQLSQDIGVPIVIRGADLQADGITKNQAFGIDVSNKPAAEILVEILRLANPDKAATGPHDPRQKLVFIVGQAPDKTKQIVVTTRARAAERHDELPAAFQPE